MDVQAVKDYLEVIVKTGREKGVGFCIQVAMLALAEIEKEKEKK